MRKIGLIGGLSWYSTRSYYELINRGVEARAGQHTSAPLLIESLDFAPLKRLTEQADWANATKILVESAQRLETAGATALLIGANSMHKVFDDIAGSIDIPVLHIADCVADRMKDAGIRKAALLGTRTVMVESFYRRRITARDIELLAPDKTAVETLDRIIYEELVHGKATRQSERDLRTIVFEASQNGAEAIALGCTELEMVVDVDANILPIYDCTAIHSDAAVDWILG